MTSSMYIHSVPVFKQMLTALKTILAQASEHATSKSIEPDALLQARLAPDMFPLLKQVQIAADFSRGVVARLAGVEVPDLCRSGEELCRSGCAFDADPGVFGRRESVAV